MRTKHRLMWSAAFLSGLLLCTHTQAAAQGTGATGAQVLQLLAGSRAPAMSGAYAASSGDADVLFYNPAGAAVLRRAGVLSYQTFVEDVALASFGGLINAGRFAVGVSGLYLRGGSIDEIVPDPEFGGNRGLATGQSLAASETVARINVALPLNDRLRLGAGAGFVSTSIASESSNTPVFDLGGQYDFSLLTLGLALRNVGPQLTNSALKSASLPTEARLGAAAHFTRADGLGVTLHSDLVALINESSAGLIVGMEGGWQPQSQRSLGAVARIGYNGAQGQGGFGALALGAGLTMQNLAVDYTFQDLDVLGVVHRFGVRWSHLR